MVEKTVEKTLEINDSKLSAKRKYMKRRALEAP